MPTASRAMLNPGVPPQLNRKIVAEVAKYRHDPLGFVYFAFPWGAKGTPLEEFYGPQLWQAEILAEIGRVLRNPDPNKRKARIAVASGKGIGKSALLAMLFWWGMATAPMTRCRVTAGTFPQLNTTTWPEILKWGNMLICRHWFHVTATMVVAKGEADTSNWRADAMPWNESAPEAFAGVHNYGRRIVFIKDEASQIATPIWDTTDGILTDRNTEIIWLAFGNPTRGEGRFHDIFEGAHGGPWIKRNIDSRDVAITDKSVIQEWIDRYGEDSDYVRAFILGIFPRVSDMQFIATDLVKEAIKRDVAADMTDPLVMGVDVARSTGSAETVIAFRKGRDAKLIPWVRMHSNDTMQVAARVADLYSRYNANALFIDAGGVGGGVHDRLRQLGVPVVGIDFGGLDDRAGVTSDPTRYANKRAAMWGGLRDWLKYGALPDQAGLVEQLSGVLYGYSRRKGVEGIVLESKDDMKKRHLPSPDLGDAIALTFAHHVAVKATGAPAGGPQHASAVKSGHAVAEYDPHASI